MLFFLMIWALAACSWVIQKGLFHLPSRGSHPYLRLSHADLLVPFGIYLSISFIVIPVGLKQLPSSIVPMTKLYFGAMITIFTLCQLYLAISSRFVYQMVWNLVEPPQKKSRLIHLGIGIASWVAIFPVVAILNEVSDSILKAYFEMPNYQQSAVKLLQAAMANPLSLLLVLLSILLLAPLLEEFLFRGLLQSYLKSRIGRGSAILLSALIFALFHFSTEQGLGNISLLLSLFVLGLFLGLLYEKRGSLWSPIGLHMTFNAITASRILLFPESL